MPDLLVKLYKLPDDRVRLEQLRHDGITVRKAMAREKYLVVDWVAETFGRWWASECDVSFANQPVSCFIAMKDGGLVGFSCYDSTMRNFFGPMGVAENTRNKGIGTALLLRCLHAMAAGGYGYAVIGDADPVKFYKKTVNAFEIPGSFPGVFRQPLSS